jgi:hypothetical protein
MTRQRDDHGSVLGLAFMAAFGAAGFTIVAVNLGPAFAIPVGIIALVAAAVVLRGPLGQALAHRLEGRAEATEDEAVLHALDEVRVQVAELAERMDFAERMLTQQREPDRLQSQAESP